MAYVISAEAAENVGNLEVHLPSRPLAVLPAVQAATAAPALEASATVAVLGLGYVGLPTALALYESGASVIGVDISQRRLEEIRDGLPDLLDSDLQRLTLARMDGERFQVNDNLSELTRADCIIVCVPTPIDTRQMPDLGPLRSACATVVRYAQPGQTFVLTSTSYVGCTRDLLVKPLAELGLVAGKDVYVCFAPERIDPANSAYDLTAVPKVIGGVTSECVAAAAPFVQTISARLHIVSSPEAAEMTKLLENTFRAVNVSLANEIADITGNFGLDPVEIINAAGTKPYGFMPFYPGPGVGGHCIPCDPHYLLWQLRDDRIYPSVISAAMQDIAVRPARIVQRAAEVLEEAGKTLQRASVLVVGLSYKPNVSDTRESPAIEIISGLKSRGAHVSVHDPLVNAIVVDGQVFVSGTGDVDLAEYDLVVVTCLHDTFEPDSLEGARLILDATYKLPEGSSRFVP